jgi:hypothetical protein
MLTMLGILTFYRASVSSPFNRSPCPIPPHMPGMTLVAVGYVRVGQNRTVLLLVSRVTLSNLSASSLDAVVFPPLLFDAVLPGHKDLVLLAGRFELVLNLGARGVDADASGTRGIAGSDRNIAIRLHCSTSINLCIWSFVTFQGKLGCA